MGTKHIAEQAFVFTATLRLITYPTNIRGKFSSLSFFFLTLVRVTFDFLSLN